MARILLVEDNEMNRDMLSRRLTRKGFEVAMAVDGLQGVEMALSGGYDLILMDMSLPELDGWEATRRVREGLGERRGAQNPAPPPPGLGGRGGRITALPPQAMWGDRERAMPAGCDDYDPKPVELDRLLGKINALL